GPPLELRFDPVNSQNEGKHVRLRSGAHGGAPIGLPPGNWNVVVEAPSWVTSLPAIPFLAEPGVARDFSIEQIWEDELDFVETTKTDEMLLVLGEDGQGKRILIPAASPALPVLKSETWKLIRLRT